MGLFWLDLVFDLFFWKGGMVIRGRGVVDRRAATFLFIFIFLSVEEDMHGGRPL